MTLINLWRVGIFLVCLCCFVILCCRFAKQHRSWNGKTRDYWYALAMWSFTGMAISVEGFLRNASFGPRLIFISAAALVTLSGLMRKGSWGTSRDNAKND